MPQPYGKKGHTPLTELSSVGMEKPEELRREYYTERSLLTAEIRAQSSTLGAIFSLLLYAANLNKFLIASLCEKGYRPLVSLIEPCTKGRKREEMRGIIKNRHTEAGIAGRKTCQIRLINLTEHINLIHCFSGRLCSRCRV